MKKIRKSLIAVCLGLGVLVLCFANVTPIAVEKKNEPELCRRVFDETSTIMPLLKTKHRSDFKSEWKNKKDEAILDFLKK